MRVSEKSWKRECKTRENDKKDHNNEWNRRMTGTFSSNELNYVIEFNDSFGD